MDSELIAASPASGRSAPRARDTRTNVKWIIGEAINDCRDLLRLRQQSVTIARLDLHRLSTSLQDALVRLLSLAIDEVSSVSSRRSTLSVWAAGRDIVIQSHHPLDIIGQELTPDAALRAAARDLLVAIAMTWDQGRGPRLTLSLPTAVGKAGRGGSRA